MSLPVIAPGGFERIGRGLDRPEGVCVGPGGSLWASDAKGLVARVGAEVERFGQGGVRPNGIAFDGQGRLVVADFGAASVFRLTVDGDASDPVEMLVTEAGGVATASPNFPAVDGAGRIWCSNSTSLADPQQAIAEQADDGFVFVVDPDGSARIVADGFVFANGIAFSPEGDWLYVAESGSRIVSRIAIADGEVVGGREVATPKLPAVPDGIAFDVDGNLWITLVFPRGGVVMMTAGGDLHTVVDDETGQIGRPSNIAFGGDDGCDVYLANLELDCILRARVDTPGIVLRPW